MSKTVVAAYVVGIVAAVTVLVTVPAGSVPLAMGAFVFGTVITIKVIQALGFQA